MSPAMNELYNTLAKERDAILESTALLKKQRKELYEGIRPTLDKVRQIDEKVHDMEQPRLRELQKEIAPLERALAIEKAKQERMAAAAAGDVEEEIAELEERLAELKSEKVPPTS